MTDTTPPVIPPAPRAKPWPAFFSVLLVVVNVITLIVLYADTTLQMDGQASAAMVRKAFITMSILNLLLAILCLLSIWLGLRPPAASSQ